MTDLIHRHTIKKKKIVRSFTSMNIKSRHEFRTGAYARQVLQRLDYIRRAEHNISVDEIRLVQVLVSCLRLSDFNDFVRSYPCFLEGVLSFCNDNTISAIIRISFSYDGYQYCSKYCI